MACGSCGARAKVAKLLPNSYNKGGWYWIDLCSGYKIMYRKETYYLVDPNNDWFISDLNELRTWAKENCNYDL